MIQRKKKICKGCGEPKYIFSKGMCQSCTPKKSIKKVSEKQKCVIAERKETLEGDKIFYLEIWNERKDNNGHNHCESCDCRIYGEPLTIYFDHLLEKGTSKFKHLRREKRIIAIVCGDCHTLKTNGKPTQKHKELIQKAILELL